MADLPPDNKKEIQEVKAQVIAETQDTMEQLRSQLQELKELKKQLNEQDSGEMNHAMTNLEQALMWSVRGIMRYFGDKI